MGICLSQKGFHLTSKYVLGSWPSPSQAIIKNPNEARGHRLAQSAYDNTSDKLHGPYIAQPRPVPRNKPAVESGDGIGSLKPRLIRDEE
jgi:hypothetical protein